jgi:hypothetical protein
MNLSDPQPIETAPKDGTPILAYNAITGWYRTRYENGEWPFADWYMGDPRKPGIWFPHPTHWTTLPDAPDDEVSFDSRARFAALCEQMAAEYSDRGDGGHPGTGMEMCAAAIRNA